MSSIVKYVGCNLLESWKKHLKYLVFRLKAHKLHKNILLQYLLFDIRKLKYLCNKIFHKICLHVVHKIN